MTSAIVRSFALTATLGLVAVPVFARQTGSSSTAYNSTSPNQSATSDTSPVPGINRAQIMVPASVTLLNTIDAKQMQPGAQFKAKLNSKVRLNDGTEMPSGTVLDGVVATDDAQVAGNAKVALRFTQAELKDGQTLPIKATIVGAHKSDYLANNDGNFDARQNTWDRQTLAVDQIDAMPGVDLHSKIASHNSGVFVTTKKDDVKLAQGAELDLALASQKQIQSSSVTNSSVRPSGS